MTRLRGILLDFYGTLVHEDDIQVAATISRIHEHARPGVTAEEIGRFWYRSFVRRCEQSIGNAFLLQRAIETVALEETLVVFDIPLPVDELVTAQFSHWMAPPIFADSMPFLAEMRDLGLPIVVVSNIDRADIEAAIGLHGLAIDHLIASDDVRAYKPCPEMFHRALDLLGLAPDEVLHIGDSWTNDVVGAAVLGIPVAWVNRTGKIVSGELHPTYDVRDLGELADLIRGLVG